MAFRDLLHLVVIGQHKECPLEFAHSLYFSHNILVDAIHDLLHISREHSQSTTVAFSELSRISWKIRMQFSDLLVLLP